MRYLSESIVRICQVYSSLFIQRSKNLLTELSEFPFLFPLVSYKITKILLIHIPLSFSIFQKVALSIGQDFKFDTMNL